MSDPRKPRPMNLPLVISTSIVAVAALVAVAVGVNHAATVGVVRTTPSAFPSPAASASPPATPSASPSATPAATIPFADCTTATFGQPLQPLNQPADVHKYSAPPAMTIDTTKLYQATITTAKGNIVLCLQPNLAPNTVNVLVTLMRNHYYDGIPFHRVCPHTADSSCGGPLAIDQGGDPNCIGNVSGSTCGQGGPGFQFADEPVRQGYVTGAVAMANSGANTNGSQFFICTGDDTSLPKSYNLFAMVETSSLAVAKQITKGDVMQTVTVAQQQ